MLKFQSHLLVRSKDGSVFLVKDWQRHLHFFCRIHFSD